MATEYLHANGCQQGKTGDFSTKWSFCAAQGPTITLKNDRIALICLNLVVNRKQSPEGLRRPDNWGQRRMVLT
jgi:hypothetical protein